MQGLPELYPGFLRMVTLIFGHNFVEVSSVLCKWPSAPGRVHIVFSVPNFEIDPINTMALQLRTKDLCAHDQFG